MRKSINAIVNVIRRGNRRNREAVVARGVDALRASGPGYRMHPHAHTGAQGMDQPQRGLFLLDLRSSLDASLAGPRLPLLASKPAASQPFAESCFTGTTGRATPKRSQAWGRFEQRAALTAACSPASA